MSKTPLESDTRNTDWKHTLTFLLGIGLLGTITLGWYGGDEKSPSGAVAALFLAGASMFIGIALGFIFGIPRSLQRQNEDPSENGNAGKPHSAYAENTNLEQISDWLTKIIVGITLVQFDKIIALLNNISAAYGSLFHPTVGPSIAGAIVIYFVIGGFLVGYLWTRIHMANVLRQGNQVTYSDLLKIENKRDQQHSNDAKALGTVDSQLSNKTDGEPVDISQMKKLIIEASAPVRVQIFQSARNTRRSNWKTNIPLMEKSIPIFEALIEAEPGKYYRNYSQLGYALKDQKEPNWDDALANFNMAIELRGPPNLVFGHLIEFCRAVTLINTDANFKTGKPSAKEIKDAIISDLEVGILVLNPSDDIAVKEWMKLNKVTISQLK